jgi:hypothetical protein
LINELGGYEGELFAWQDLAQPATTAAPASEAASATPPPAPNWPLGGSPSWFVSGCA